MGQGKSQVVPAMISLDIVTIGERKSPLYSTVAMATVQYYIFKPGARLVSWNCFCVDVCMRVCVSAPEAINNWWRNVAWYGPHTIG